MIKLNIFVFFIILTSLFFLPEQKENQVENFQDDKKLKTNSSEEKYICTLKKEKKDLFLTQIRIFKEQSDNERELLVKNDSTNSEKEDIEPKKNEIRVLKTVDEMMDTLFPNLEEELGSAVKEEYKYNLAISSIYSLKENPLTKNQRKEFLRLHKEKKESKQSILCDIRSNTVEELERLTEELKIVKGYYIPKMVSILTIKQQDEFAKYIDKLSFKELRDLKKTHKNVIHDSIESLRKLQEQKQE